MSTIEIKMEGGRNSQVPEKKPGPESNESGTESSDSSWWHSIVSTGHKPGY